LQVSPKSPQLITHRCVVKVWSAAEGGLEAPRLFSAPLGGMAGQRETTKGLKLLHIPNKNDIPGEMKHGQ
tara:strand:- start:837 stop:1046 length:210 start_codon:yes stop_codon:yes gene_type:complete